MALVYRSDRKTIFDVKKKRFDTGPGQYLPIDFRGKIEPNKVPFFSSSKKESEKKLKEGNPGPGFYQKDEELENFLQNLHNSKPKRRLGPIYKSLDVDQITSLEPLGFLSRIKRFEDINSEEVPGPGYYNKPKEFEIKSFSKTPLDATLKNKKILYQHNKLVSIPAKHQSFGYQLKGDGKIELSEDPLKNFRHKGEVNDCVGPGEYDIPLPWKKKNKGTEWSKYRTQKNYEFNPKKSQEDLLNTSKNQYSPIIDDKNEKYEKNKKEKQRFLKDLRSRVEKRHKLVEEKNKSFTANDFDKLRKIMESPGPGYYEMNSSFNIPEIPQNFQYFGSIVERFPRKKDEKLGPGRYFRDDTFVKKSPQKNNKAPFNSKTLKNSSLINNQNLPGPGHYDQSLPILKKNFAKHAIFDSSEARFAEIEKLSSPGPGQYSPLIIEEPKKNYKYGAAFKASPREKINPNKEEEAYPSVGQYNTELFTSLSYSVDKKVSRPSMVNAPFNSLKNRFEKIKKLEYNIGPGQYHNNEKITKEQKSPPFQIAEKRFKEKKEENVGPGEYDRENYFDWNKKSFNILYL